MLTAFPTPVLSIAADAVRDLEGRDALSGLWTLFTKCKESLQDGRRLENISWRLWYRDMMRDDSNNRLYQNEKEKEDQEIYLGLRHPNSYRPPTPSELESMPPPPPYAVQDGTGLKGPALSYRTSLISATAALPQDHHHAKAASSPNFSSSSVGLTQDTHTFRSISPTGPTPCPPLDSTSASLQMSNPESRSPSSLPVQKFSPSVSSNVVGSSSSGLQSPCDFADISPQYAHPSSSVQPARRRMLSGSRHCPGSNAAVPVCVGRIIYDMLPCKEPVNGVKELKLGLQWAGPSSMTTTTTQTLTAVASIPTPVETPTSYLQPSTSTTKAMSTSSTELVSPTLGTGNPTRTTVITSTTTTTTTRIPSKPSSTTVGRASLHTTPPSPSLSESYALAHPGERDEVRLQVGVGLGPSLSVSSPSSPHILGNTHIFGLSPNPQLPPIVVVVNPTPNLTPQPTPPASPLISASTSGTGNKHNGLGVRGKGDWLMLPPHHHDQIPWQDQAQDRSRSEDLGSVSSITTNGAKTIDKDANQFSSSNSTALPSPLESPLESPPPPQLSTTPFTVHHHHHHHRHRHHQSVDTEDKMLLTSSEPSFVQDLEISAPTNPNRHSISSTTTIASTTDSAASTATAATSMLLHEDEIEELKGGEEGGDKWTRGDVVVGSPVEVLVDADAQPVLKSHVEVNNGPLGSLSTIQSVSVKKSEEESAVFTSGEDTDVEEELGDERGEGSSTRLKNPIAAGATATSTMKKKKLGLGAKTKVKTKIKPVKRNSLRSPTSVLSPPLPPSPSHQVTFLSPQPNTVLPPAPPPIARRPSSGRSSSRSASRSGRSSVGFGGKKRTNSSSASRSRSRENRGGRLLGMTATAAGRGERKKAVIAVSTIKPKQRPKFMLGRPKSNGGSNGKIMGGQESGLTRTRRESSGVDPGGTEENSGGEDEKEREGDRKIAMEMIQLQRRQQLLVQQQQLELEQRMGDEQRALAAKLARQHADAHEAEIRRQRQRHLPEQQQQRQEMQGGTNGLLGVSTKRPVRFNIGSNSDEGSAVGSNSKSGSEISGVDRLVILPVADGATAKGKGKEQDGRDDSLLGQQQQQPQQLNDLRQPQYHPYPQQLQPQMSKQNLYQLGMMQQQYLQHQQQRQQHIVAPNHHPVPHQHYHQQQTEKQPERQLHRQGEQVMVVERQVRKEEKGKEREHSNPNTNSKPAPSNSKVNLNDVYPAPPPPPVKTTKIPTHETLNMVSSALAAKVKHTLSDPLLPGQHKRTIVLATSESEFEDSEDDGSWSSEEMGSEDEEEKGREEQKKEQLSAQQPHPQQQQQLQRQLQQQQQQQRPPPVQRTHSSNYPPGANYNHTTTRAQRNVSTRVHRHAHSNANDHPSNQALMAQAAQEAQRQREMFAKKPTESFQNLTQVARTQSVGLLTQLMNPNPEIFPVGHPYRRGYSSSEIRGVGGGGRRGVVRDREVKPLQPLTDVKAMKKGGAPDNKRDEHLPPSRPEAPHRKSSSSSAAGVLGHSRATSALSPPARTVSMQLTKSSAAMPVSSQVQVGSVSANAVRGHGAVNGFGMTNMKMVADSGHSSGGYRPKGPPEDQELEDESGSEPDSGGGIQVSKSVAQEKLKALAARRGIVTHGNQPTTTTNGDDATAADANQRKQPGDEDDVPQWAKVSQPRKPTRTRSEDQYQHSQAPKRDANRRSLNGLHFSQMNSSTSNHINHPTPIPVGHPYNLPPPAPPSTPRTTRRLMLSTELSESLRRNLLWERQLSKVNLAATVRRTASGGGSRYSVLGGLQPLTTAPNMVQLHPKGTIPNPGSPVRTRQEGGDGGRKERRASGGAIAANPPGPAVHDENEREERKRLAMARNRSWANDYHYAGW